MHSRSRRVAALLIVALAASLRTVAAQTLRDSEWQIIMKMRAGSKVRVTRAGFPPMTRWIADADPFSVTLVNLDDSRLSKDLVRLLSPQLKILLPAATSERILRGQPPVSIGPAGLFVGQRRVMTLRELVKRIPRAEIAGIRVDRGHARLVGALIGAGIGVATGLGWASGMCDGAHCYASGYVSASVLFGAAGAGIALAIVR
jgi:hypothetical protein